MQNIEQVIDDMLARARREHPGVEWVISTSREQAPRLTPDAHELHRTISGAPVVYPRMDVYDDCEVQSWDYKPWLVIVAPLVEVAALAHSSWEAVTYYCDLRSGEVTTTVPADALFGVPDAGGS